MSRDVGDENCRMRAGGVDLQGYFAHLLLWIPEEGCVEVCEEGRCYVRKEGRSCELLLRIVIRNF